MSGNPYIKARESAELLGGAAQERNQLWWESLPMTYKDWDSPDTQLSDEDAVLARDPAATARKSEVMDIENIINAIRNGQVRITDHADKEAVDDVTVHTPRYFEPSSQPSP